MNFFFSTLNFLPLFKNLILKDIGIDVVNSANRKVAIAITKVQNYAVSNEG